MNRRQLCWETMNDRAQLEDPDALFVVDADRLIARLRILPTMGLLKKPGRRDSLCPYLVFDFGMLRDVGTQGSRSVGTVAACLDAKIATAEVVHVDASLIRADFADGE